MNCATCTESIGSSAGLVCVLHARLATEPCEHYEREPGAEGDMQVRPVQLAVWAAVKPMLYRQAATRNADAGSAVPAREHAAERERGSEA